MAWGPSDGRDTLDCSCRESPDTHVRLDTALTAVVLVVRLDSGHSYYLAEECRSGAKQGELDPYLRDPKLGLLRDYLLDLELTESRRSKTIALVWPTLWLVLIQSNSGIELRWLQSRS